MNAKEVLAAVRAKHNKCAIVTELVVEDAELRAARRAQWARDRPQWADYYEGTEEFSEEKHGAVLDSHKPFRRIDALMFDGGGTRTAIEVKVTRADFKRETEAKRRPWELITNRFVYATPAGLIQPGEVPAHCGLWWVDTSKEVSLGWNGSDYARGPEVKVVKRAKTNKSPDPIPHQVVVAMAYRLGRVKNQ